MNRLLPAVTLCAALTGGVSAAPGPWQNDSSPRSPAEELSRDAQRALICQTVTDWAAYQVTKLIRDDASQNQAISPEGMQILRQIRLTAKDVARLRQLSSN